MMDICNFMFFILAVAPFALTNTVTNISRINVINTRNITETGNGDGVQTIFVTGLSLGEICALINISKTDCTCENFADFCQPRRIFVCSRYWDKVEGTVKITVSVIGVLGNALILVIALKTWRGNGRFRKLVAFLALADLTFAIVQIITAAPLFTTCKWLYKTFFCKILKGTINIGGIFALCLITIIALERYLAIAKPFTRSKFQFPFWLWPLLALLFSIISVIPVFVVYEVSDDGVCVEKWPQGSNGSLIYSCYLLIGTFLIPLGIISYFYCCVVKKMWTNARNLQNTGTGKIMVKKRESSNKRVMFILLAITIAFFVCVFPNRIIWVILDITGTDNMKNTTFRIWKYTALFPYLFHVSVNPFIYSFIDRKFQEQVVGLFKPIAKSMDSVKISSTPSNNQMAMATVVKKRSSTQITVTDY